MKKDKTDVWFDFSNPPHVNLFLPILKEFHRQQKSTFCTAREFVETKGLLEKYGIPFESFGKHGGKNRLSKAFNLVNRNIELLRNLPQFKLSISSSFEAPQISWLRGRPAVVFDDNEIAPNWLYSKFVKHVIAPSVIDVASWQKSGIKKSKVIPYNGYKEDVYIADYIPDPTFLNSLPFSDFITVRPENIFASYVPVGAKSIVAELIEKLTTKGLNILYLPRYEVDRTYAKAQPNIFIPQKPLNGLDVCYYSKAVLTGAGTFAREAALLGVPAVSFFAGNELLTVDKSMISKGIMLHTRQVEEIVDYVGSLNIRKNVASTVRSKEVQKEVFTIIDGIFNLYL